MRRVIIPLLFLALAALACNMPHHGAQPPAPIATSPASSGSGNLAAEVRADAAGCTVRSDWPAYTVALGDMLSKIAERTGSTVEALAAANCLADPGLLEVGQTLHVPVAPGPGEHTITPGETLAGIARAYGVPLDVLATANGIVNIDHIYAGQVLTIPNEANHLPDAAPQPVYLNVPVVKQSRNLSCESASACSLLQYMGYACAGDMVVFDALPRSIDNPHRGFVGSVDSLAGTLPPGAAAEKTGGYGVYVEALHAGLQSLGVKSQYTYNASLDTLRGLLNQGAPVLIITTHGMGIYGYAPVNFVPADGDGTPVTVIRYEHSYVLTGYDDSGFWAIDPWSGAVEYFDSARLDADWARLGRQALWVTG